MQKDETDQLTVIAEDSDSKTVVVTTQNIQIYHYACDKVIWSSSVPMVSNVNDQTNVCKMGQSLSNINREHQSNSTVKMHPVRSRNAACNGVIEATLTKWSSTTNIGEPKFHSMPKKKLFTRWKPSFATALRFKHSYYSPRKYLDIHYHADIVTLYAIWQQQIDNRLTKVNAKGSNTNSNTETRYW